MQNRYTAFSAKNLSLAGPIPAQYDGAPRRTLFRRLGNLYPYHSGRDNVNLHPYGAASLRGGS
jgi:hypothetical protein